MSMQAIYSFLCFSFLANERQISSERGTSQAIRNYCERKIEKESHQRTGEWRGEGCIAGNWSRFATHMNCHLLLATYFLFPRRKTFVFPRNFSPPISDID